MTALDPADQRERILEEATRLFVARGYHGIAMREIAEAAGISKAGLYYHFKDKEDLFLAILGSNLSQLAQLVRQARQAPSARAQIEQIVRGLLDQPPNQRAINRLATHEIAHVSPERRAAFVQLYQQQFIDQLQAILHDGVRRGELRPVDPHIAVWLLLGMLYPFFGTGQQRGGEPHEQVLSTLLTTLFDGLAVPE